MKLILPNIYGVKVPSDANDFKLFFEFGHTRVSYNNLAEKKIPLTEYTFQNLVLNELVDFKILGTLTKDEISFDASEVVDSTEIDIEHFEYCDKWISDYQTAQENITHKLLILQKLA